MTRKLIESRFFSDIILGFVFFNTLILSLDGAIANTDTLFGQLNLGFTIVFAIEMGLKMIGLGLRGIFYSLKV